MDVLWSFWQATWGCVQSLIGLVVFCGCKCRNRDVKWFWYRGTIVTFWERGEGLSLGLFVFVNQRKEDIVEKEKRVLSNVTRETIAHELGHCRQSAVLGPLYLFVIGIPSLLWCKMPKAVEMRKEKGVSYEEFYPERWAEAWKNEINI
ncbi:MAG: hypothetical protein IKU83_01680 [Lachnospiraceae bacterium]|nr:hypothetical protein [Lachnospiraceae bacterium]